MKMDVRNEAIIYYNKKYWELFSEAEIALHLAKELDKNMSNN